MNLYQAGIDGQFLEMESGKIAVRSIRQAKDWSLVLLSQGIESMIVAGEEGRGWALQVKQTEYSSSLQILKQYQLENRSRRWPATIPWPEVKFDWTSLAWVVGLICFHWMASVSPTAQDAGVMDSKAVLAGQWWRVFTAMTLHADIGHLVENLSIGVVLMALTMGRYGNGTGAWAAYLAGALGNLTSLLLNHKPFTGLGASGMVMGALGLLAAQSLPAGRNRSIPIQYILGAFMGGIMLFLLFGMTPGTDIAAHGGGFLAGMTIGILLTRVPQEKLRHPIFNPIAGLALLAFIAWTWRLAMKAG